MKKNQEIGMILILVMVFLFVISLLTLSLLEQGLLELKMANHFRDKMGFNDKSFLGCTH